MGGGHWKRHGKDGELRELWGDASLSLRELARRVGMSPTGAKKAAERLGLGERPSPYGKSDEKLKELVARGGLSLRGIARAAGMSPAGAKKAMIRLGLYASSAQEG